MKKCPSCNTENADEAKWCVNCGMQMNGDIPQPAVQTAQLTPRRSKRKALIAVAVVIVAAIIIAAALWVFYLNPVDRNVNNVVEAMNERDSGSMLELSIYKHGDREQRDGFEDSWDDTFDYYDDDGVTFSVEYANRISSDKYGENWEDAIDDLVDDIEDDFDVEVDDVQIAIVVIYGITEDGDEAYYDVMYWTIVKIEGEWLFADDYGLMYYLYW